MLKSKKSKGSQLEIWLMNFVIGIPLVLLYFVVGIPSYFEIKELPVGPFKFNDKIYYANSLNQYCNYGTFSEYLYTAEQSSLQNLTQIPMIPASYVDLKECVVNPKEGFFKVAKEFYYSNGNDAYCRVVDIEMLSRFKAGSEMSSIYVFERLPPTLKNDGVCRDKLTGLFRVGEDTFLGKNSSYCKIKNSQEFVNNLPAGEVEKSLVFKKLPNLTDTGHCNNLDLLLATVEGEIGAEQQKVDSSDHWNASNSGDDPCLLGKSSDGRPIYFISKDYYNTKDLFRLTPSSFLTRIKLPSSNPLKISLNQGAAVCFKKGEVYQDFSLSVVGLVAGSEARLDISAFGDEASVAIIVPAKENYSQDTKMFSATFAIKIEDRDNVRIANLLIDGRGRRGSGLYLSHTNPSIDSKNITIDNVHAFGFKSSYVFNQNEALDKRFYWGNDLPYGNGLSISSNSSDYGFDNVKIVNSSFWNNQMSGVASFGPINRDKTALSKVIHKNIILTNVSTYLNKGINEDELQLVEKTLREKDPLFYEEYKESLLYSNYNIAKRSSGKDVFLDATKQLGAM